MYNHFFKRLLDFLLSLIGFVIIFPIFIIVTILLFFTNNGKPFFLQERPGKNEKIFKIIKYKTMNEAKDKDGNLLPASQRITKIGAFVRKTSIDEIPQLLNVIKGDMSIVGPRPLRVEYLPLYDDFQRQRHDVRPGITGWAQVNGRNAISWEEKFNLDAYYVENLTLILDVKIIFLTIKKVFKREGINENDNSPMKPFKGVKLNG